MYDYSEECCAKASNALVLAARSTYGRALQPCAEFILYCFYPGIKAKGADFYAHTLPKKSGTSKNIIPLALGVFLSG